MKKNKIAGILSMLVILLCSCGSEQNIETDAYENLTSQETVTAAESTAPETATEAVTEAPVVHKAREFEVLPKDVKELYNRKNEDNCIYVYGTLSYDENGIKLSKEDFYSSNAHMMLTGDDGTQIACSFTDLLDRNNFDIIENEFAEHYNIENYADQKIYMYGSLSTGSRLINCRPLLESEVDDFCSSINEHKAALSERVITIDELEDAFKNDPYDAYLKYNFFRTNMQAFHSVPLGDIFNEINADADAAFAKYDLTDCVRNNLSEYQWYATSYGLNTFFAYDSTHSFKGKYFSETGFPMVICIATYYDENLTYVPSNDISCYPGYMVYSSDPNTESFKNSAHKYLFYDINEYDHIF